MNRTWAKHAALRRIAVGGARLGLLQPDWPDNTLDELCKAGLFTWLSGDCRLTDAGVEVLAAWDAETPSGGLRAPDPPARRRAGRSAASERSGPGNEASQGKRTVRTARRALPRRPV